MLGYNAIINPHVVFLIRIHIMCSNSTCTYVDYGVVCTILQSARHWHSCPETPRLVHVLVLVYLLYGYTLHFHANLMDIESSVNSSVFSVREGESDIIRSWYLPPLRVLAISQLPQVDLQVLGHQQTLLSTVTHIQLTPYMQSHEISSVSERSKC